MELVELKGKDIYCDSHMVARKFKQQHAKVIDRIKKVEADIDGISMNGVHPKIWTEDRIYRGQKYKSYLMNRDFFSFLMMRFRGKNATKCQLAFIAAFNLMEQRILQVEDNKYDKEWIGLRIKGKTIRKSETDTIKKFVEYATSQGSKSAKFYYKHITNATYKALGLMVQKNPKLRDAMNIYQVSELLLAERVARNSLNKYMGLQRNYKDIYESVKDDLVNFANGLRIE